MSKLMTAKLLAVATLMFAASAHAATEVRLDGVPSLEPVDHIPALGRIHSWEAVDRESLIIWRSAFDPYLVRLNRPSPELRFAHAIGVTEFGGRIHARFDSVYIDGWKYNISEIYRLSKEDAKAYF